MHKTLPDCRVNRSSTRDAILFLRYDPFVPDLLRRTIQDTHDDVKKKETKYSHNFASVTMIVHDDMIEGEGNARKSRGEGNPEADSILATLSYFRCSLL